ncbi:MAG: hypothetical protein KC420_12605 [Myxococcales bacterium]|nr:hypothetical protein [Myxococcales bacterium]MCB9565762.1 hypothetical protein [Myxococcales bacterium]
MKRSPRAALALALLPALPLGGCVNDDVHLYEVTLRGEIQVPRGGPYSGHVHLELRHARSGEGGLAYPLRRITTIELDGVGPFEETFLVPTDEGEGLVAYAWLDRDGDGLLCAPGTSDELAGLREVDGFPAHALEVTILLEHPCAGAEILYAP